MSHSGVFTGRIDIATGEIRVPHGLGEVPAFWTVEPLARFAIEITRADERDLIVFLRKTGPLRTNFPIAWFASSA